MNEFDSALGKRTVSHDRLAEYLLFGQIILATFLQKFAIPLGGEQIYLALPLMLGLTVIGMFTGRLRISPPLFIAYAVTMAVLLLTQMFASDFSLASVLLLVAAHGAYIVAIRPGLIRPRIELKFFVFCMSVLACCGIAQYGLQFVIGADLAFIVENHVPADFVVKNFHGLNPLGYNSGVYKSNGVFFLEPAIFCQFLAIALIIEMLYFRNWVRVILFLAAIAVTFSGTGLIILMVLLPIYLAANRQILALILMLVAILTAGLWMPLIGLEHTYERAFEFMNPQTSGYARFISMFRIVGMFLLGDIHHFLFGLGAGSISTHVMPGRYGFETFDPTWGKVVFEYGFVGLLAYLGLVAVIFWQGSRSRYLKAALLIQFLLLGEFVLSPTVHGVIAALLVWPSLNQIISPTPKEMARPPEQPLPLVANVAGLLAN